MYIYKSFCTYPYNQKHENSFIKFFLGFNLQRFPYRTLIFNGLANRWLKNRVVKIFVFDIRQKLKSWLFEEFWFSVI